MKINLFLSGLCCALLGAIMMMTSCNSVDQKTSVRTTVSTQAVASFKEKINDSLNKNWYFSVDLFETAKPLDYIVHMGYEEMSDADTIHFPDLGYPIKPAVQKGPDSLSCYIGFLDPQGQFMYLKGIWFENNRLNIRTVRTYKTDNK